LGTIAAGQPKKLFKKLFKKSFKKVLTASEGHVIMYLEATGTLQIINNGGVRYDRKKICKGIS
jgi:hypothetical protein